MKKNEDRTEVKRRENGEEKEEEKDKEEEEEETERGGEGERGKYLSRAAFIPFTILPARTIDGGATRSVKTMKKKKKKMVRTKVKPLRFTEDFMA